MPQAELLIEAWNATPYHKSMNFLRPVRLSVTNWKWWYFVPILLALVIGFMVPSVLVVAMGPHGAPLGMVVQSILFGVLAVLIVWLVSRKRPTAEDLGCEPVSVARLVVLGAIGAALLIGSVALIEWMGNAAPSDADADLNSWGAGELWTDVLIVVTITLCAPIGEELLFRGTLLKSLRDGISHVKGISVRVSSAIALVLSAVLFYTVHETENMAWTLAVSYIVNGLLYGGLYLWAGLAVSIAAHSLNNAVVFLGLALHATSVSVHPVAIGLAIIMPVVTMMLIAPLRRLLA